MTRTAPLNFNDFGARNLRNLISEIKSISQFLKGSATSHTNVKCVNEKIYEKGIKLHAYFMGIQYNVMLTHEQICPFFNGSK
jgi:hypothetical protein